MYLYFMRLLFMAEKRRSRNKQTKLNEKDERNTRLFHFTISIRVPLGGLEVSNQGGIDFLA